MKTVHTTLQFDRWHDNMTTVVYGRIQMRLTRLADGHYGDHKRFDGLVELRLHFGSGYRIYLVERGREVIVLLAGGDKSSQKRDIKLAKELARSF